MESDPLIKDLETCGWFADLSDSETATLKKKLGSGDRASSYLHLAAVVIDDPDLFGDAGSLMEDSPESEITSYEDLLRAYVKGSDGNFSPEAIIEEADDEEGHFAIGFLDAGRIYALFLPGSPRFHIEFNDLVNEALDFVGARKRFFVLPTEDQSVAIAYITPSVFERACQMGIIPLDEDLFSEIYGDPLGNPESASQTEPESPELASA